MLFLVGCVAMMSSAAVAAEAEPFSIARLVICDHVADREPVGVANHFTADSVQVYCFLEARDIPEDTTVSFVWYYFDKEEARIPVRIGQSARWRTFASKKIGGRTGDWRVEIQDAANTILGTVEFKVE